MLTLLAALVYERQREITDTLADLLISTVHRIGARAERRVTQELVSEFRKVAGKETHAIAETVSAVVDIVKTTLDKCPPELSGDVMDRGIALTGGGALLRGLDERLGEETGMPVCLADNPLESVVLGTGKCVEDFDDQEYTVFALLAAGQFGTPSSRC